MPFTLTMPKLSPTMEAGTVAKWHKKEGEFAEAGDLLLEVSTDKATVEHNALDAGWLKKIMVQEGSQASVNQPIAIFTEEKDESIENYTPEGVSESAPEVKKEKVEAKPQQKTETKPETRVKASPLAKKLAKEKGIDLSQLQGTGPGGRIMKADLEQVKEQTFEMPGSFTEETLTPMRQVIAKRLQESKNQIPHFYVRQIIDAEPLVNLRNQLKATGSRLSYNDCVMRAVAIALNGHPEVNRGFNNQNQTIINFKTVDLSFAVSLDEGLITPIVRYADKKDIKQIASEVKTLAAKAREGKLEMQEYQGGSFTVSNLGMYGITDFQAIINPPQGAILAVSGILDVPVVKEGRVIPGKQMNLTLSCDHRVIDGAQAAKFMTTLKTLLENPAALLL